jgi:hypothetical protein
VVRATGLERAGPMAESVRKPKRRDSMQHVRIQITGPGGGRGPGSNGPPGLLARILVTIIAVVLLAAAAFLGAIFFLAALGVFVAASVVLAIRIWWARRQIEKAMNAGDQPRPGDPRPGAQRPRGSGDVIEGEYMVVDEHRERDGAGDR